MIPLFHVDEVLHVYLKTCWDIIGEYIFHYKELLGFKCRHDFFWDVMFDIFRRAITFAKKKVLVNFLSDPQNKRSTSMLNNVLV